MEHQKIFVHTDKDAYHVEEDIWFKAYVVDAVQHKVDTLSGNLYVDLIDFQGRTIRSELFRITRGMAHGDIEMPDSLAEGNYKLRVYTHWMRNFSDAGYFEKPLYIINPDERTYISRGEVRDNRRFNEELEEKGETMQFAFFPEGGHLVQELETRIAFKAANSLGEGMVASGWVADGRGNVMVRFETLHDGMGFFYFTPGAGQDYWAEVEFENGQRKTLPLPGALPQGYAMQVDHGQDFIDVEVAVNFDPAYFGVSSEVFLVAHARGDLLHAEQGRIFDGRFASGFSTLPFPSGVIHIALFDGLGNPVAERSVFVKREKDYPTVDIDVHRSRSNEHTVLDIDLYLDNAGYENSDASFSLGVTEIPPSFDEPMSRNIVTYYLLESDIGHRIEKPWYYFETEDAARNQALDLLMMVHGWRRFSWPEVLSEDWPTLPFPHVRGVVVAGNVRALSSTQTPEEVHLELFVDDAETDRYAAETDEAGNFSFDGLDYDGEFKVTIGTPYERSPRNLWVDLNTRRYDPLPFFLDFSTRPHGIVSRGGNWVRTSRPRTWLKASAPARPRDGQFYSGTPDQVIYGYDVQGQYNNILELIMARINGLVVRGNQIVFRGQSTFFSNAEPLFFVDGMRVHQGAFLAVSPEDIERVEAIRGARSAIFGIEGGNGALLVFTRRGRESGTRLFEYMLRGYTIPRDYYTSQIDVGTYQGQNLPRTIYWNPVLETDAHGMVMESIQLDQTAFRKLMIVVQGLGSDGHPVFSWHILD